jgi:tRNA (guanine-N7-)-methyltransferase
MGYGIKSYVIRSGRMSAAQRRSCETLSPRFCVPFAAAPLDFPRIFGNEHPVTLEIGFGMGAATALIAGENPGRNYLGVEVHRPGIGRLLWEIESRGLANIRIIEADAADVLEQMIPDGSLEAFHIFFPDPWPKKRHHKRRLITRPFTALLAEKLRPGGYVYMVTDWADYGDWALAELSATEGLRNVYGGFAPGQAWRPRTRFEQKGLEKNHEVRELYFIKGEAVPKPQFFEQATG